MKSKHVWYWGELQKHVWALKSKSSYIFICELNPHLSMHGSDIFCGISKCTLEIPHKISCPYIERCDFNTVLKFKELLDVNAHKCFLNAPLVTSQALNNHMIATELMTQAVNHRNPVVEIPTGPPVRGRQLWRRIGNFLLIFLQFYVYDLRLKPWGSKPFLTEF